MNTEPVFEKKPIDLYIEESNKEWVCYKASKKLCESQFFRSTFILIIMSVFTAFGALIIYLLYMKKHMLHKTDTLIAICDKKILGYHAGYHKNEMLSIDIPEIHEAYDRGFGYLTIKDNNNSIYTIKNKLLNDKQRAEILKIFTASER